MWSKLQNGNLHQLRIWPIMFFNKCMHWGITHIFIIKWQTLYVTFPRILPDQASIYFSSAVKDKYLKILKDWKIKSDLVIGG